MRKIATGVAAASVLALAAGALAPAATAATTGADGTRSLATVLTTDNGTFDRNWNDYDIVTQAVLAVLAAKPDSAVGVLTKGDVPLTAFIPSDRAFRTLVKDLTGKAPSTEAKTFAAVAGLGGIDLVETVLLYHVVPGATIDSATALNADDAYLETGVRAIRVDVVKHKGGKQIRLKDADSNSRNARVNVADLNKGNVQIAHGVDRVMRPLDLPPTAH
jgi:uncharacterized surface protein with fasciclin (FAS1) repeats